MAELRRKHLKMPVYVAVDTSQSMGLEKGGQPSPWAAANEGLQMIAESTLVRDPELRDLCLFGVLTFNEETRVHRDMLADGPLSVAPLPRPVGQTDFRKLFENLLYTISADLASIELRNWQVKRPVVFILTDGYPYLGTGPQPPSVYQPKVRALHQRMVQTNRGLRGIAVVPFGFGDADPDVLRDIRSSDMHAYMGPADATGEVVTSIMKAILNSIVASASGPEIRIRVPQGVRTLA
jgi:uncharacterized protein YegL